MKKKTEKDGEKKTWVDQMKRRIMGEKQKQTE